MNTTNFYSNNDNVLKYFYLPIYCLMDLFLIIDDEYQNYIKNIYGDNIEHMYYIKDDIQM